MHSYARDHRVDLVVLEDLDDGRDGGVVDRQDGGSNFFFERGVGLEVEMVRLYCVCACECVCLELTLRERILTWCFPVARIASTMARPTLPVPPATATIAIFGQVVVMMVVMVI